MSIADAIANRLETLIDAHGVSVDILPYSTSATSSVYRQRDKQYAVAVPIKGMVSLQPSEEELSMMGESSAVDGMITFCRKHIETAFPTKTIETAISDADEVGALGKRWRISKVHIGGRVVGGVAEFVAITYKHRKGLKNEAYP